ncbi:MAG: response regulator [Bacteroidetes bacterium]|nr:response regulator [Bacteroidota bacterium]MCL6100579.1 response regulator [Bacteroidota bacterium]
MTKTAKLLIVEDDDLNQKLYMAVLSKEFDTTFCANDVQFYAALPKKKYDIFLIDLALGKGEDGISLIKKLRQMDEYKSTPIIVVTAYAFKRDEDTAMAAGATKFIRKPVDNKVLLNEFKKYFQL